MKKTTFAVLAVSPLAAASAQAERSRSTRRRSGGLADAVERNPNDAKAHYDLGCVLWAQGGAQNTERTLEACGNAIQLDPTLAEPWRDAGFVFYELRDMNRSAKAFEGPKIQVFLNAMQAALQGPAGSAPTA